MQNVYPVRQVRRTLSNHWRADDFISRPCKIRFQFMHPGQDSPTMGAKGYPMPKRTIARINQCSLSPGAPLIGCKASPQVSHYLGREGKTKQDLSLSPQALW